MAGLDDGECLGRVRGIQRRIAKRTQLRQHIVFHQPVVLDDKDRLVTAFDLSDGDAFGNRRVPIPGGRYILIVVPWPPSLEILRCPADCLMNP